MFHVYDLHSIFYSMYSFIKLVKLSQEGILIIVGGDKGPYQYKCSQFFNKKVWGDILESAFSFVCNGIKVLAYIKCKISYWKDRNFILAMYVEIMVFWKL